MSRAPCPTCGTPGAWNACAALKSPSPEAEAMREAAAGAAENFMRWSGSAPLSNTFDTKGIAAAIRNLPIAGGSSAAGERIYIDCEFDGHGGPLLSIAMVGDHGSGIHIRAMDAVAADPWVIENVIPLLNSHEAGQDISTFTDNVGAVLRRFIGSSCPTIVADSPVDIGRFCAAISTSPDGAWASADYPRMTFEVHNVDCYPTDLEGAVQHNAWWDAMALRHLLRAHLPAELPGGGG